MKRALGAVGTVVLCLCGVVLLSVPAGAAVTNAAPWATLTPTAVSAYGECNEVYFQAGIGHTYTAGYYVEIACQAEVPSVRCRPLTLWILRCPAPARRSRTGRGGVLRRFLPRSGILRRSG